MKPLKVDNNTYVFSDPHYGHKNFVAGETSWFYSEDRTEEEIKELRWRRCRPFDTVEEMNDIIVKNINSTVPENATLICLGDWSFGGIENIWNFRKRINCKDIHLILGNHDHHIANNRVLPNVHLSTKFDESDLYLNDEMRFKDGPNPNRYEDGRDEYFNVVAEDLFTSVSNYKEIQFKKDGMKFDLILSHYAMRVWNKSHRGSIMLYGHSHGTLDELKPEFAQPNWIGEDYYTKSTRTMDVGMDCNNLYPYSIEGIVHLMMDREVNLSVAMGIDYDKNRPKYEKGLGRKDFGVFGKPRGI